MYESAELADEAARLQAVTRLAEAIGTVQDPDLKSLVEAAALACGTPISLITLLGADTQWFKAQVGLEGITETAREFSFCTHTILQDLVFEISDTHADPRFAVNPMVTGGPEIGFYAGAPITTAAGHKIGTLCVMDTKPHKLTESQRRILAHLAQVARQVLETLQRAKDQALLAAKWQMLNDCAPFGLYTADAQGMGTYSNQKLAEIFGLTQAECEGDGWLRGLHPEDREPVRQAWEATVATGVQFDQEFRLKRPDGQERQIHSLGRRMTGDDGATVGVVGTVEEVTEIREKTKLLDSRRQWMTLIVDATGIATNECNLQTFEMRFSPEWLALTGHDPQTAFPVDLKEILSAIHPEDQAMVREHLAAGILTPDVAFEIEYRKRHKLGHWVWLYARSKVITCTADGKPEWLLSTMFDITARKEAQEKLRRAALLLNKTGAAAGIGGWSFDLKTSAFTWTDEMRRLRGVGPDFVPDISNARDGYPPEDCRLLDAALKATRLHGTGFDLELRFVRPDGRMIWVRAIGSAELEDGIAVSLAGSFQDITDLVERRIEVAAAHQRMVLATESTGIGIWELDITTRQTIWDRQMYRLFGHDAEFDQPNPNDLWELCVHPDDRSGVVRTVEAAIAKNNRFDKEYRLCLPDGSQRHIRSLAEVSINPKSGNTVLLGVTWDVTQLRSLVSEIAGQHEWMRVTLRSIGDAVITTDAQGVVIWLNPVAEGMTGWALKDAIGRPIKTIFNIVSAGTLQPVENPVERALKEGQVVQLSAGAILVSRTGQQYGIEDSAAPIRDDNDRILGAVLVFHDATKKRLLEDELTYRATHDALTGIKNRSEFELRLDQLRLRAHAGDGVHAMLYLDLDNFKRINDSRGHAAGDQVLQDVSRILMDTIRSRDLLARVGGDEFAILLEDCPPARAMKIAQQICDQMAIYRFSSDDQRLRIGASVGVVAIDRRWTASEDIVLAADGACRLAKETGRNRVRLWREKDGAIAQRRDEVGWAARLEQALDGDQFRLFVQAILPLDPGRTGLHGEILLRLAAPDGSMILPGQFLSSAERFNLITQIDLWVLRETIKTLQAYPDIHEIRLLSLNFSGRSVADRSFHRFALAALAEAGPELCQRLAIEITETTAIGNLAAASHFIDQLHDLGVQVSLDDFGAGTASFGYLRALNVDCLKIDGQFVQGLLNDPLSQAMVRCFTEMAQILGIPTVAEYVDHPDILIALKALGVTFAQGHLIAQAVPILDFLGKGGGHPDTAKPDARS